MRFVVCSWLYAKLLLMLCWITISILRTQYTKCKANFEDETFDICDVLVAKLLSISSIFYKLYDGSRLIFISAFISVPIFPRQKELLRELNFEFWQALFAACLKYIFLSGNQSSWTKAYSMQFVMPHAPPPIIFLLWMCRKPPVSKCSNRRDRSLSSSISLPSSVCTSSWTWPMMFSLRSDPGFKIPHPQCQST